MRFQKKYLLVCSLFLFQSFCHAQDSLNHNSIADKTPQTLQISHIEINDRFFDFRELKERKNYQNIEFGKALDDSFDSVATYYNYPLNLNLPYYLNNLTFHFSAIDWKAPHKVKYSYFLEGYDKDWSEPGNNSSASYKDLPNGNYVLKIKTVGETQIWSDPFIYTFSIRKPWWKSWWAYTLYALALFSAVYSIFYFWQERKRQEAEIRRLLEAYQLTDFPKAFEMKKAPHESSFLNLVQTTLKTHLSDENFGIAELCELLNISRTQLHRKLKKLTGLSTSHYIRSLRLEIAKELLETTNLNISEVAFKVGFSSATYFSKVFKSQFGYAPSDHQ